MGTSVIDGFGDFFDDDFFTDVYPTFNIGFDDGEGMESGAPKITPRTLRLRVKQDLKKLGQRSNLKSLFKSVPADGEQVHIISAGMFNFWTFTPVVQEILNRPVESLYCATWMVNAQSVQECLDMMDAGQVRKACWLVGKYLKARDPSTFYRLNEGVKRRAGWVKAIETHIKIILIESPPDFITITGSANMSENKRLEGAQVTNSRETWEFYKAMFEEAKE